MSIIVRVAAALLPPDQRDRFAAEWRAELHAVERSLGKRQASMMSLQLLAAAPRMTMYSRSSGESAYVELSVASLSALFPTSVFAVWAALEGNWVMAFVQLLIGVGVVLVSAGLWSHDGRLLDSVGSRIGLVLVLAGSVIGTAAIRYDDFSPLASQEIDVSIPNTATLLGLAGLLASNYAGRFRRRAQLASMYVLLPASIIVVCVAVLNAMYLPSFERLTVLLYAVPALVLTWACFSIIGRPSVFVEDAFLDGEAS